MFPELLLCARPWEGPATGPHFLLLRGSRSGGRDGLTTSQLTIEGCRGTAGVGTGGEGSGAARPASGQISRTWRHRAVADLACTVSPLPCSLLQGRAARQRGPRATSWRPPLLSKKERGRLPSRHQDSTPSAQASRETGNGETSAWAEEGILPNADSSHSQWRPGQGWRREPSSFLQETPSRFPPCSLQVPTTDSRKSACGTRATEIERAGERHTGFRNGLSTLQLRARGLTPELRGAGAFPSVK